MMGLERLKPCFAHNASQQKEEEGIGGGGGVKRKCVCVCVCVCMCALLERNYVTAKQKTDNG